jgi:hypothetical protein
MALDSGIPSQDLRVDATAAELRGNKQSAAIIRNVASNRQSIASGRRGDPTKRQVDIKPSAQTIESLGKVSFAFGGGRGETDFKRDSGPGEVDLTFPEVIHGGGLPFIKFDIFEINSNPGADVKLTVQNRSSKSLSEGAASVIKAGSNLVESTAGAVSNLPFGQNAIDATKDAAAAVGKLAAAGTQAVGAAAGISFDPQKFKDQVSSLFKDFSLNRYSDTRVASITLPIPDGLTTQYSQNYGQTSLTKAFGAAGFGAQALAEPKFLDKNDPYLAELSTTAASKIFNTSEDITNILQFGLSGRVVNPQMEMLYQSPNFREFTFDFRLIPRTASDTGKILNIIQHFKYFSAPTFCGATTGRYYVPPARFAFSFFDNAGQPNNYLFRSKQCVVTNIAVDYAPNGYATHSDGSPVEVRLSVQLQETAMITAADLDPDEGGFNY